VNLLKADIADLNAVRKQITGKRNRAQRLTAARAAPDGPKVKGWQVEVEW